MGFFFRYLIKSKEQFLFIFLFSMTIGSTVSHCETSPSIKKGVGATLCFDVISWQHHETAKKDITKWVVSFIDEVNKTTAANGHLTKVPIIKLSKNLVWFGTLAYCSLDTKQTLAEATMKLITNEWEKSEKR